MYLYAVVFSASSTCAGRRRRVWLWRELGDDAGDVGSAAIDVPLMVLKVPMSGRPRAVARVQAGRADQQVGAARRGDVLTGRRLAVADVFWVAHLGANAVATVGLTESMLTMIYTAAMGLSIGAMALVSRRIGEQDPDGASRAAGQSILLGARRRGADRRSGRAARRGLLR